MSFRYWNLMRASMKTPYFTFFIDFIFIKNIKNIVWNNDIRLQEDDTRLLVPYSVDYSRITTSSFDYLGLVVRAISWHHGIKSIKVWNCYNKILWTAIFCTLTSFIKWGEKKKCRRFKMSRLQECDTIKVFSKRCHSFCFGDVMRLLFLSPVLRTLEEP